MADTHDEIERALGDYAIRLVSRINCNALEDLEPSEPANSFAATVLLVTRVRFPEGLEIISVQADAVVRHPEANDPWGRFL